MELSKRTPENWCATAGKQRHLTKGAARAHRQQLRAVRSKDRTSTYRCGYCDGYHVGRR